MADPNASSSRSGGAGRNQEYIAVPRVPYSPPRTRTPAAPPITRNASGGHRVLRRNQHSNPLSVPPKPSTPPTRNRTAEDVQMHNLGGGFGPYAHSDSAPAAAANSRSALHRHQRSKSSVSSTPDRPLPTTHPYTSAAPPAAAAGVWDQKDDIDPLHDPDPLRDAHEDQYCDPLSARGWFNMSALLLLCFALIVLFAGYPIISWAGRYHTTTVGYNLGGINGSGQVPVLPGLPLLIDNDTPKSMYTRTGHDGKKYNLVFSDEFNTEGRTFWPGDDAFWEAVDLHYWPTGDLEWYSPDAITTANGSLVITMIEQVNHNLNFQSGMLQSWNKLCFSSGYVEVNVSLPGNHESPGFWPAAWTMGNLGRAGYGATTEGMWPYSYDSCDLGTFLSQQDQSGNPTVQTQLGSDGTFSSLPGQKVSACTCPGEDHPGPSTSSGRGVPEVDIFEAQIEPTTWQGEVSQSFQIAPFNADYQFDESEITMYDTSITKLNSYLGGPYQQAVSSVTNIPNTAYVDNGGWATYGYELWGNKNDRDNSFITWFVNGQPAWTATAAAIGADSTTEISNRLIAEEPMYIIFNLGMAYNFQRQDWMHLEFPAKMMIDYVRVYQRSGQEKVGCDPSDHPTSDYIASHLPAYSNPNYTTWEDAGYRFPRNQLWDGC